MQVMGQKSEKLDAIETVTLSHYNQHAEAYWHGTKDHDVSQNLRLFWHRSQKIKSWTFWILVVAQVGTLNISSPWDTGQLALMVARSFAVWPESTPAARFFSKHFLTWI